MSKVEPEVGLALMGVVAMSSLVTFALAVLGEPQSAWLICDVIGMEVCP